MPEKNKILVYVELNKDKEILPVSLESINIGRKLADKINGTLVTVTAGKYVENIAKELLHYGVDTAYYAESPEFEIYQPESYLKVMERICEESKPAAVLFGNTLVAIDLAPRIALSLEAGLITDSVNIDVNDGEILCTKAVYSSNVMAEYGFESSTAIVTIRARAFDPAERNEAASGECIKLEIDVNPSSNQIEWIESNIQDMEGVQLTNADVVVSGGRGMGGEEGFDYLKELCSTMGAALGSSRPPCDLEWVSAKTQVGLTGEIIAPSLYVAVGISGSFQHIAGMNDSKVIVAINRDERANIFNIADYGVVGEFEDIVPEFNKALKEIL